MAKDTPGQVHVQDSVAPALDPVTAMLLEVQRQNNENQRLQVELQRQQLEFQQQSLAEERRIRPHENAVHPAISAYSYPEGDVARPKPRLTRPTFCPRGVKQREDLMTPEEIDAFNAITHSCSARDGSWTATVTRSGTTERLEVDFPCKSPDDRMNLPNGLLLILRELKEGPAAVDINTMAARIVALESKLAAQAVT